MMGPKNLFDWLVKTMDDEQANIQQQRSQELPNATTEFLQSQDVANVTNPSLAERVTRIEQFLKQNFSHYGK